MRTVTTAEELDALPVHTVLRDFDGYILVRAGGRWRGWPETLKSDELGLTYTAPFTVVASPEPDGLHDLATACTGYPSEDWQHVARRVSRESTSRDVRDVAEALLRTFFAVKHHYDEVEQSHRQLDAARKRIDELENPDVPTVDGWSRHQWLEHAGHEAKRGQPLDAQAALGIAEAMREGDV